MMTVTDKTFTMMQTDNEEDGYAVRIDEGQFTNVIYTCLLYTSPSPRD